MKKKKILIACEYSGIVRDAFIAKGHDAISCDLLPTESPGPHYQGDVRDILYQDWDMIIAFPECRFMSNAGACRMYPTKGIIDQERLKKGLEAKDFFMLFYNHPCKKVAIENPRPLKVIGLPQSNGSFQPYEHGHPYTKKTLLWLKGLPDLLPSDLVEPIGPWVPSGTSRKDKSKYGHAKRGQDSKNRSLFWSGVAKAMADQWEC